MENTLLISLSHQSALRRRMDVVANNIANMNTTAFKGERLLFVEHLVPSGDGRDGYEGQMAFVEDVATYRDISEGPMQRTGNPLDLALRDDGLFVVEGPEGDAYTRNGHFRIDDTGQIVNEQGMTVMSEGGAPIVVGPTDVHITVSGEGVVSSENGELGRLRVVRFDNAQALTMGPGGLMSSDVEPEEVIDPTVAQGMLEQSNVNPILEMERMMLVHRSYEHANKLAEKEHERIKTMMDVYAA